MRITLMLGAALVVAVVSAGVVGFGHHDRVVSPYHDSNGIIRPIA